MAIWTLAAYTHRGLLRAENQDAVAVHDRLFAGDMTEPFAATYSGRTLLMVADGLGGHADGARASQAALSFMINHAGDHISPSSFAELVAAANEHIYQLMEEGKGERGMGTTLAGAVLLKDHLITFNVGDSTCSLFSNGNLVRLSVNDRLVDQLGRPTHILAQSIGGSPYPTAVQPHASIDAPLAKNESLLICSDGLTDMVSEPAIRGIMAQALEPLTAVRLLAARAFKAGARDNISLILAQRSFAGFLSTQHGTLGDYRQNAASIGCQ